MIYYILFLLAPVILNFHSAKANSCINFLSQNHDLQIEVPILNMEYDNFKRELESKSKEKSVRKIVTLFNTFKSGYHDRYDLYVDALLNEFPELKSNTMLFYGAISTFHKLEKSMVTLVQETLIQIPAKKRIHYLRSLTQDQLIKNSILMDTLFGYAFTPIHPADWSSLIDTYDELDLDDQQIISMSGPEAERLGLLMGLLRPEVQFIGILSEARQTDLANELARQNGFTNISYK